MLRVVSPAALPDVLQLYAAAPIQKPRTAAMVILQFSRSESVSYFDGDKLIAAAMYYPLPPERPGETLRELAFVCLPEFSRQLVAFIHHARLTPDALAKNAPVRIRARVRAGHEPGRRLAVLCGFRLVAVDGLFERWEIEVARHEQIR